MDHAPPKLLSPTAHQEMCYFLSSSTYLQQIGLIYTPQPPPLPNYWRVPRGQATLFCTPLHGPNVILCYLLRGHVPSGVPKGCIALACPVSNSRIQRGLLCPSLPPVSSHPNPNPQVPWRHRRALLPAGLSFLPSIFRLSAPSDRRLHPLGDDGPHFVRCPTAGQ